MPRRLVGATRSPRRKIAAGIVGLLTLLGAPLVSTAHAAVTATGQYMDGVSISNLQWGDWSHGVPLSVDVAITDTDPTLPNGPTPTGTITISYNIFGQAWPNGAVHYLGCSPLVLNSDGDARCVTTLPSDLPVGQGFTLWVMYSGDQTYQSNENLINYDRSQGPIQPGQAIGPVPSLGTPAAGPQGLTFPLTATIKDASDLTPYPSGRTPTGTVTVTTGIDGSNQDETCAVPLPASGSITCPVLYQQTGKQQQGVWVDYSGDSNWMEFYTVFNVSVPEQLTAGKQLHSQSGLGVVQPEATATDSQLLLSPKRTGNVPGPYRLIMQGDGNLVLYTSTNKALWSTRTAGHPGARLVMQGDGNLVLYSSTNKTLWDSHTVTK